MSRKADAEHLAAKKHVAYAEEAVAKQRELIAGLRAGGHPTHGAHRTLENLGRSLELLRRHLRRFERDGGIGRRHPAGGPERPADGNTAGHTGEGTAAPRLSFLPHDGTTRT